MSTGLSTVIVALFSTLGTAAVLYAIYRSKW
jgi:hypothetical protein